MVKRAKVEDDDDIELFYEEHRAKLTIDRHGLDDEWVEQPGIVQAIGERLAIEISRRDEAKDQLADIIAEVDGEVRLAHDSDDEDDKKKKKPTETAIKNEVAQDKHVKAAKQHLRTLELNVGRLGALKDSFHQRRYALQDLVSLYLGGYYTSNSGAAKSARENTHESSRKAMQDERVKKRKEKD